MLIVFMRATAMAIYSRLHPIEWVGNTSFWGLGSENYRNNVGSDSKPHLIQFAKFS